MSNEHGSINIYYTSIIPSVPKTNRRCGWIWTSRRTAIYAIHFVFYGVPGNEKTWEETAQRLAKWLGENIPGKTVEQYDDNIWRAHRGPLNPEKNGPRPIFCKMNYRYAEHIKDKLKFGKLNTGVTFREQYCPNTQARVNEALVYRKDWKARNGGGSAYISFPAVLKVKEAGATGYKVEKSF